MTNIKVMYAGQQQQTITSLEVAEMVGREHKNVMRDIEKIKDELSQLKIEPSTYFHESTYINSRNKEYPMYSLTKKGCEVYGNRMTGIDGTAFTIKFVERFNEMEQVIQHNLPTDPLELALTAALDTRKEVAAIKEDVDYLKDNMRINTYQEKTLQDIVKRKAMKALGGYKSLAYEMLATKVFRAAWRDFKNHFGISTYKELPAKRFDEGVKLLNYWEPGASLRMDIESYQNQQSLID
mgnify:FL=1